MARTGERDESPSFSSLPCGWKSPHCPIYPTARAWVCVMKRKKTQNNDSNAHSDAPAHTPRWCPMEWQIYTHIVIHTHTHTHTHTPPSQVFPKWGKEPPWARGRGSKDASCRRSDDEAGMSALWEFRWWWGKKFNYTDTQNRQKKKEEKKKNLLSESAKGEGERLLS